jgi:hypothetical protein
VLTAGPPTNRQANMAGPRGAENTLIKGRSETKDCVQRGLHNGKSIHRATVGRIDRREDPFNKRFHMRKRSLHRLDATLPGHDSLMVVLTAPQALAVASRLLQQLRTGSPVVEIHFAGAQMSLRPPAEAPPVAPVVRRPRLRKKDPAMMAMGAIAPTHLAGGLRS